MSRITQRDHLYSKAPLSSLDNRPENIIIDVLGNWIPECDLITYGLLNSPYSEILHKLRNTFKFNPRDLYLDTCYFSGDDLIRYLASEDPNGLADLTPEFLQRATEIALQNYLYVPCNETMFRHSIIELAYFEFVQSITLVYPWEIREIDYRYLRNIIPYSVMSKFRIVSGKLSEHIKSKPDIKYTTIVSNSLLDINEMIDNCNEYGTEASFFLLRNHSENVTFEIIDDPDNPGNNKMIFNEIGTVEILSKLMDVEKGIPKTQMRFARYEPMLFSDAKPNDKDFSIGR